MIRYLAILFVFGMVTGACNGNDSDVVIEPEPAQSEPTPTSVPEPTTEPTPEPTATKTRETAQSVNDDGYLDVISDVVDRFVTVGEEMSRIDAEYEEGSAEHEAAAREQLVNLETICDDVSSAEPPMELEHDHFNLETGFCGVSETYTGLIDDLYTGDLTSETMRQHNADFTTAGSFIYTGLASVDERYETDFAERSGIHRP